MTTERNKKLLDDFIFKSKKTHGNKYDYSKVVYKTNKVKVCIYCPIHNHDFWVEPKRHYNENRGCEFCSGYKWNKEIFIEKAREIHGDRYDYSFVEYKNNDTKINIFCNEPNHGYFYQMPSSHINLGHGCMTCFRESKKSSTIEFIEKSNSVHNNKYDYSKSEYKTNKIKVEIICSNHGSFFQRPDMHLIGQGCQKCNMKVYDTDTFILESKKNHLNKYDYSSSAYIDSETKIKINCRKHGDFLQIPIKHVNGSGCPICKSSKGEIKIMNWLINNNIKYSVQKMFDNCKGISRKLPFDFYLPDYNICIEFDGRQHFEEVSAFGGIESFIRTKDNDKIKSLFCFENSIGLIRIHYKEINNIETILVNNIFQ